MLFYLSVVIFSLLIGSFLNVVIHRLPIMLHRRFKTECLGYLSERHPALLQHDAVTKEVAQATPYNLVVPRSACPQCGHKITALENIPVLSYLWLRGRCRGCQTPISLRYPLVETLTTLLAVVVAWKFGVTLAMLMAVVLTFALISLTFIDLDTQYLPDEITLPLLWLGLILNFNHLGRRPRQGESLGGGCSPTQRAVGNQRRGRNTAQNWERALQRRAVWPSALGRARSSSAARIPLTE